MHPAILRVDLGGEGFDVGGEELGELAVFQDHIHHGVLPAHFIQHACSRGVMAGGGLLAPVGWDQSQALEEHIRELLRGVDVEGSSGCLVDLPLQGGHAVLQLHREGCEELLIQGDPRHFHVSQHGNEGHFDLHEQVR